MTASFSDLGVSAPILAALTDMGFEEPTPIQVQAIPPLLAGRDLIGQAQTGTGKTAAYAIPALQGLNPDGPRPQVLVLCPTRELALQVTEEVARIGAQMGSREVAIYGGQPIERQVRALRAGADVVVGTPGRLLDHLRRGTLKLDNVRTVVLDEGDEMLDMGFIDDIETILRAAPADRRTALFSATLPPEIQRLSRRYLREPVQVRITPEQVVAPSIEQAYYEIGAVDRTEALCRLIDVLEIERAIIFCRTKRSVDVLTAALQGRGYPAEGIHGDLAQTQRLRALGRFREGASELLVATDVAARGLDIEGVTHVINFHIADSAEAHVHRIGRTGRVGRSGIALTLVDRREVKQLRAIAQATRGDIPRRTVPTPAEVARAATGSFRRQVVELLQEGSFSDCVQLARELSEEYSPLEVAAAAMKLAMDGARSGVSAVAAPEPPSVQRLFVNVGGRDGVRSGDLVRAVSAGGEVAAGDVGAIDVHDDFSFMDVPQESADAAIAALRRWRVGSRPVNAERARPR